MTASIVGALVGFLGGAIIGSFLATVILRWPQGRSVATGRSRCDGCGRTLGLLELVPILSAVSQGQRCRTCGQRIDPMHLRVEIAAGLCGATALGISPDAGGLVVALFGWLLIPLALLDWRHFWLPDRLTALLAATGIAGGWLLKVGLVSQLIGGLAGFAALYAIAVIYKRTRGRTGLGAGDPKLFGAVGLWLGWQPLAAVLALAAAIGLCFALTMRRRAHDQMPFGTMLAIGAWPVALARIA